MANTETIELYIDILVALLECFITIVHLFNCVKLEFVNVSKFSVKYLYQTMLLGDHLTRHRCHLVVSLTGWANSSLQTDWLQASEAHQGEHHYNVNCYCQHMCRDMLIVPRVTLRWC